MENKTKVTFENINFEYIKNKNLYVFESNHDIEKLMNNPKYPHHTKIRILSDKGHLSNKDSAYYLSRLIGDNTKYVILAHISEQNNILKGGNYEKDIIKMVTYRDCPVSNSKYGMQYRYYCIC